MSRPRPGKGDGLMVARILLGCLGVVIVVLVGVFADRWVNACAMDDTLSESRLEDN